MIQGEEEDDGSGGEGLCIAAEDRPICPLLYPFAGSP